MTMIGRSKSSSLLRQRLFPLVALVCGLSGCFSEPEDPSGGAWNEQVRQLSNDDGIKIDIDDERISDAQLSDIRDLTRLQRLRLGQGSITDAGLKTIAHLPKLEELVLRESPLTDEGAEILASFPALKIVNVPQTHIGDDGLRHLARIPNLVMLRLGSDQSISADALASLKEARQLRFLHFIHIPLTDDALTPLAEIETLESLYIDGASFSDEALSKLLKKRPGLHLHLNQRHHDSDPQAATHPH